MKNVRFLFYSLLLTLGLWTVVSWPLPMHVHTAIPASSSRTEPENARAMVAGDHLQFLYHLWLGRDTFLGNTPLFHNLYEFNRDAGTEDRRSNYMTYYLPFSLFFTGFAAGGQALGWNGTGFASLWITLVFTWLLARRYTPDPVVAVLAAMLSILFPYRWITLLGGSPTGLSMMWVPIAFYGIDVMVRDRKWQGAALAGAAIFLSGWSDPHVAFFAAMGTPCWCLVAYLFTRKQIFPDKTEIRQLLCASVPLFIFGVFILLQAKGTAGSLGDTALSDNARRISEVALFSPRAAGLCAWNANGNEAHIYIGWFMLATLSAGMLAFLATRFRHSATPRLQLLSVVILFAGIGAALWLSTGIHNPGGDLFWVRLCRLIPPYGMIRQPSKVFILLPTIIAVFIAITLPILVEALHMKGKRRLVFYAAILAGLIFDYARRVDPAICILDKSQGAYQAVAEDARQHGRIPLALGIPLWPGDSHWSSLNQYYSTLYRVRMVNGYRPTVRKTYYDDVFMGFQSINEGSVSDAQLRSLQQRGIHYIILHEDAFPEKVSLFPVAGVLHALLAHPQIKLLKQDGAVWAFRIMSTPQGIYEPLPAWNLMFPSRLWEAEHEESTNAQIFASEDASSGRYLQLANAGSALMTDSRHVPDVPDLFYTLRTRTPDGAGTYSVDLQVDNQTTRHCLETQPEWSWQQIRIPVTSDFPNVQMRLTPDDRTLDIDAILLIAGKWNPNVFEGPQVLPAPLFFHAGHTDLETGEVVLSPDREPADIIFYGPKLPMPAGTYKITLDYRTDAKEGTLIGSMQSRYNAQDNQPADIIAGKPAEFICIHPDNLRFSLDVKFNRSAVLRIRNVIIEKVD